MGYRDAQQCHFCEGPAVRSLVASDGKLYVPVCKKHERRARKLIRKQEDAVVDVHRISPLARPDQRAESAFQPIPDFGEESAGTYFGLQADAHRRASALMEQPLAGPAVAPLGRADVPRGNLFPARANPNDVMARTDVGIRHRSTADLRTRSTPPLRVISGKYIPDSFLQMLGTDWRTLRATRIHDNRMTLTIDGINYTLYTRRG